MSEPLLNVMKIMLLAGLYLFFVRVLWSVYNELRDPRTRVGHVSRQQAAAPVAQAGPAAQPHRDTDPGGRKTVRKGEKRRMPVGARSARSAGAASSAGSALIIGQLEMLEPAHRVGATWALGNEVTLGRADTCDVHLDDTYVSGVHARIFNANGTFSVEDLDSRNGTLLNDDPLPATRATPLEPGDRIRIGQSLLEFS